MMLSSSLTIEILLISQSLILLNDVIPIKVIEIHYQMANTFFI